MKTLVLKNISKVFTEMPQSYNFDDMDDSEIHQTVSLVTEKIHRKIVEENITKDDKPSLSKWFLDNLDNVMKNYVALEVYEKTLSHKVMPTEDWKIDIQSIGPSEDRESWVYEWKVKVETQPALITGSFRVPFQAMLAECMKTALSR